MAVLRLMTSSILGRRLHRQVGRLLALEDAVDVAGGAAVLVDPIRPIGDQAAGGDEGAVGVDGGQLVPGRQRDDQIAMNRRCPPASRSVRHSASREGRDGALDFAGVAHVERAHLHPERWRHGLDCAELASAGGCVGIAKDRHARHAGRDLLEQFQPFSADAVFEKHETGGVAARARQAVDEAGGDRIAMIGNTIGTVRVACSNGPTVAVPEARMTSGASATNSAAYLRNPATLAVAQRMSIRTLRPSIQPSSCSACRNAPTQALILRIVRGAPREHADAPHPLALLRARRERPRRRRAAEKRDEFAPLHARPAEDALRNVKPSTLRPGGEGEMPHHRPQMLTKLDVRFGSLADIS